MMEGLWILVGAALSTGSGIVVWWLSSRTAREVQETEHSHDADLQDRRLEAEREAARSETKRAYLKQRAQPLLEFLEIVEREQGRRLLEGGLRGGDAKQRFEAGFHQLDPAVKAQMDPLVWENLGAIWEELVRADTQPAVRWQDLIKEYGGKIVLVLDEDLRLKFVRLLAHLSAGAYGGQLSESEVSTLVVEARIGLLDAIIEADRPADRSPAAVKHA